MLIIIENMNKEMDIYVRKMKSQMNYMIGMFIVDIGKRIVLDKNAI